jgi:methyl-accepting chemotaxis protein
MDVNNKALRKKLFVDSKVQGALIARVVVYWILCLITITLMLLCWDIVTGPARMFYTHFDDMWFFYGPAAVASLLLLPLVIVDIIRISNRFVGPLLRLRRSMRALARGDDVEPIEFRGNDFWHDFADEFNAVRARIIRLSAEVESEKENEEPLGVGF